MGCSSSGEARFAIASGIHDIVCLVVLTVCGINGIDAYSTTGVSTFLAGSYMSAGDADGEGTVAQFNRPMGTAVRTTGTTTLYIADSANHKIKQIDLESGNVTTLAGNGYPGMVNGGAAVAKFYTPTGLALTHLTETTLYVADMENNKIRWVAVDTGLTGTTVGGGTSNYPDNFDGTGTGAGFCQPSALALSKSDAELYIADTGNHLIRAVELATGITSTVAGGLNRRLGAAASGASDGTGTEATFNSPAGIALTPDEGMLYVADSSNHLIRAITLSTGVVTTVAGRGVSSPLDTAIGTSAGFAFPLGLQVADDGEKLYIADRDNNAIREMDTQSGFVSTVVGSSDSAIPNDYVDGTGTASRYNAPAGITLVGTTMYISDMGNEIIRSALLIYEFSPPPVPVSPPIPPLLPPPLIPPPPPLNPPPCPTSPLSPAPPPYPTAPINTHRPNLPSSPLAPPWPPIVPPPYILLPSSTLAPPPYIPLSNSTMVPPPTFAPPPPFPVPLASPPSSSDAVVNHPPFAPNYPFPPISIIPPPPVPPIHKPPPMKLPSAPSSLPSPVIASPSLAENASSMPVLLSMNSEEQAPEGGSHESLWSTWFIIGSAVLLTILVVPSLYVIKRAWYDKKELDLPMNVKGVVDATYYQVVSEKVLAAVNQKLPRFMRFAERPKSKKSEEFYNVLPEVT